MKLLIVDDQKSLHLFLDKMLPAKELGISKVLHADDGQQAIAMVQEFQPDILLLDIKMPGLDGVEVLKRLTEQGFEGCVIILSAYNEFEYARKCMQYGARDYLLKPVDMNEFMEKIRSSIVEIHSKKREALKEAMIELLEEGFEQKRGGSLKNPAGLVDSLLKREDGFFFVSARAGDGLENIMHNEQILCHVQNEDLQQLLVICHDMKEWETAYEEIGMKHRFSIGVSRFVRDREQVVEVAKEARQALTQGFYNNQVNLFRHGVFRYPENKAESVVARQLTESIDKGDVQAIKLSLEKLFAYFKMNAVHPEYVYEFCYCYLIGMNKNFMDTFRQLKSQDFTADFKFQDAVSLKNTFFRFIISICCKVKPEQVLSDSDTVKKIKHYVEENYEKDLSLATITKHFFISKYQVSRLFKKMFEVNYSEYVLSIRMKMAAHLLVHTQEKVENIARQVGFEDAAYFSRVFSKSFSGCSPGEYRKVAEGGYYRESFMSTNGETGGN